MGFLLAISPRDEMACWPATKRIDQRNRINYGNANYDICYNILLHSYSSYMNRPPASIG